MGHGAMVLGPGQTPTPTSIRLTVLVNGNVDFVACKAVLLSLA
jgi:hypothetical protein